MSLPLAYFLTWTCYGQRLHGDPRGTVDRNHNVPGTPLLDADEERAEFAHDRMAAGPFTLSESMRPVVARAFADLCAEREWRLIVENIRTTHIHIVLNCRGTHSPERAMSQLKARATRDLRRAGLVEESRPLWTRHGSTRWINHAAGLAGAIGYVRDWQDGARRRLLEEHRRELREHFEGLSAWLRERELPASGLAVIAGESEESRTARLSMGAESNEPRTK